MASKVEGVVDGGKRAEHALNDLRQHGLRPVNPPLKRARRISTSLRSAVSNPSVNQPR